MLRRVVHYLERAQWRREIRRVTHPFAWGIEHLGGDPARDDPREFLRRYADQALSNSDHFFATTAAPWYRLENGVLTFPSAIESSYGENNLVRARWFPTPKAEADSNGGSRRAVIVLPQWNADAASHVSVCRVLAHFGVGALLLSLPYHGDRKPGGIERADYMVCPDIGLTLQASRQAVLDARRSLRWLEQQGYDRLGILGTSIGSAISFITLAHEPALRAGVFLHVSTYFADVVRRGLVTSHVWAGLESQVTAEEIRHYWAPISPYPYVEKLKGAGKQVLMVSGRYDLTFLPDLSRRLWQRFDELEIPYELLELSCGHYTLAHFPFSYRAGLRFIPFLRRVLS